MDSWPSFAWLFLIVKLFHFLQYRILVESASDCMTDGQGTWTTGPLELKKIAYNIFFELMVLLAIHGRFLSFRFHCLLSALLCGSNTAFVCFQKFPGTFKALCLLLLSEQMRYPPSANLSQVKTLFRIVCTLPSDMPVQLAISLTDNRASSSTTIFTAAMLALVREVLGLLGYHLQQKISQL